MNKKSVRAIGLMSGTSLDGLDLVCVDFEEKDKINYRILACKTVSYAEEWRNKLKHAFYADDQKIEELHVDYGTYLGLKVNSFIDEFQLENIDFIASHGHTIFHRPEEGFTLQIGDGQTLACETQIQVVCDFRTQDVKLGGQGAPLVPIGDRLLFAEYDYCLNLGGFANISYEADSSKRIAFDICPVNVVLNKYAQKLGSPYDAEGKMASQGVVNPKLLDKLNALEFYKMQAPKSLGMEWVEAFVFSILDEFEEHPMNVLRTFVEHIAIQIALVTKGNGKVLATGGGVYNSFLLDRIRYHSTAEIYKPSDELIDYKEALIFGLLGFLRLEGKVNCLASVTGAKTDHSSGENFNPKSF